jgi:hypothetical protein
MRNSHLPWWSDGFRGSETDWFSSDRWDFRADLFSHRSAEVVSAASPAPFAPVDGGPDSGGDGAADPHAAAAIAVDLVHEVAPAENRAALTLTGTDGGDTLIGTSAKDTLSGLGGNDTLKGKGGDDVLDGGTGRDKLIGGNGDDRLTGGSGNDTLTGNKGDDTLIGGTGDDVYRGQFGADVFVVDDNGGDDTIRDFSVSEGDRIDVRALGITGFWQLQDDITTVSSSETTIDFKGHGSTLTLVGSTGTLGPESFIFADPAAGAKGDFDITVVYSGSWTASLKSAFSDAVDRFESIIWGDLPSATAWVGGSWTTVDDVAISAALVDIDGEGGILGQAGPTSFRASTLLPATGLMRFDVADANWLDSQGSWDDVITHEMAHVLGFGTLWPFKGLLTGAFTSDPRYVGAEGMQQYGELLGTGGAVPVPVEQEGGLGTRLAHWDEETFGNELMTGYLNPGSNPLSVLSAASFADLGYDLAPEANWLTDPYVLDG